MFDYVQLQTLSAIVRLGSFEAAAAALSITQSAVSQRLRALEDRIGQPLVRRSNPCEATDLGLRLARHADEVALMESGLAPQIDPPGSGPHLLRIAANADSLAAWLVPALARAGSIGRTGPGNGDGDGDGAAGRPATAGNTGRSGKTVVAGRGNRVRPMRAGKNAPDAPADPADPAINQAYGSTKSQPLAPGRALVFDIVVDDQDYSADWLKRGEVTAAITSHANPPSGCDSLALGSLRYIATANPDWIARYCPKGVTASALRRAPMMTFDHKDQLQMQWLDREFGEGPRPPSHFIPSTNGFVDGALAGLGWGMNPEPLVDRHLQAGRLVPLIPDRALDVALYWQVSRRMAPVIADVTKAVRDTARHHLHQGPPDHH